MAYQTCARDPRATSHKQPVGRTIVVLKRCAVVVAVSAATIGHAQIPLWYPPIYRPIEPIAPPYDTCAMTPDRVGSTGPYAVLGTPGLLSHAGRSRWHIGSTREQACAVLYEAIEPVPIIRDASQVVTNVKVRWYLAGGGALP